MLGGHVLNLFDHTKGLLRLLGQLLLDAQAGWSSVRSKGRGATCRAIFFILARPPCPSPRWWGF